MNRIEPTDDNLREVDALLKQIVDSFDGRFTLSRPEVRNIIFSSFQKRDTEIARLKEHLRIEEYDNEKNLAEKDRLRQQAERLAGGLKGIFGLMEKGILIRSTEKDSRPDWAIKSLETTNTLVKSHQALADYEKAKS